VDDGEQWQARVRCTAGEVLWYQSYGGSSWLCLVRIVGRWVEYGVAGIDDSPKRAEHWEDDGTCEWAGKGKKLRCRADGAPATLSIWTGQRGTWHLACPYLVLTWFSPGLSLAQLNRHYATSLQS
jgi:hypothetical protein